MDVRSRLWPTAAEGVPTSKTVRVGEHMAFCVGWLAGSC